MWAPRGCCCSHINSHNQVCGHRTGSSHSGADEYPRENTHNPRWCTHILQLTQFMQRPETCKSEIGSQSTMCQVNADAYVSFLTPGETKYSTCRPGKSTTYILHVVSITTRTHDRRKSNREKKQRKEKKTKQTEKGKKREEKDQRSKKRQYSTRRGSKPRRKEEKAGEGKILERKMSYEQTLGTG